MKRVCCRDCRLRFTAVAATYLTACPRCGLPPTPIDDPASVVGFGLVDPLEFVDTPSEAIAVSLPPQPEGGQS
jgi:hypothetical protein